MAKKRKYTDEELSRILSAHEGELLRRGGLAWDIGYGCVNQFAYNEPDSAAAYLKNETPASWFDFYYASEMTSEQLLESLDQATGRSI